MSYISLVCVNIVCRLQVFILGTGSGKTSFNSIFRSSSLYPTLKSLWYYYIQVHLKSNESAIHVPHILVFHVLFAERYRVLQNSIMLRGLRGRALYCRGKFIKLDIQCHVDNCANDRLILIISKSGNILIALLVRIKPFRFKIHCLVILKRFIAYEFIFFILKFLLIFIRS